MVQIVEYVISKLEVGPCAPVQLFTASCGWAHAVCAVQERPAALHALENAAAALHTPSDVFIALFDKTLPTLCGLAGKPMRPHSLSLVQQQHGAAVLWLRGWADSEALCSQPSPSSSTQSTMVSCCYS